MVVGAAVRGADEVQLLCSWCKVVIMYEVVVSYVIILFDCEIGEDFFFGNSRSECVDGFYGFHSFESFPFRTVLSLSVFHFFSHLPSTVSPPGFPPFRHLPIILRKVSPVSMILSPRLSRVLSGLSRYERLLLGL